MPTCCGNGPTAASVSDSGSDNSASTSHASLMYVQITGMSQMRGTLIKQIRALPPVM